MDPTIRTKTGSKNRAFSLMKKKARDPNAISGKTNLIIHLFFVFYSIACVLPVLLVLSVSFSDEKMINLHGYKLIPMKFSTAAYHYLMFDAHAILEGYGISILVTFVGSILGLLITALFAYPLSRQDFSLRNFFSFYIFFTMLFNGGLVPWYLVYTNLFDLRDSIFALIIPNLLMNAFFVLMMRTFFQTTIHPSIIESASIDGAGEFRIFFRIVLPLSLPVLATIGLFYVLGYWNDWFNSLVFINNSGKVNLQYLMYKTMMNLQFLVENARSNSMANDEIAKIPNETVRMAMCIIGMGPIVFAYPFFQNYFVKGLTIGAVKG
jgi:putative aldouronate transport system permease protein